MAESDDYELAEISNEIDGEAEGKSSSSSSSSSSGSSSSSSSSSNGKAQIAAESDDYYGLAQINSEIEAEAEGKTRNMDRHWNRILQWNRTHHAPLPVVTDAHAFPIGVFYNGAQDTFKWHNHSIVTSLQP